MEVCLQNLPPEPPIILKLIALEPTIRKYLGNYLHLLVHLPIRKGKTKKLPKKNSGVPPRRNVKRKTVASSMTSSDSYVSECQKKREEFMELFALPKEGGYSQEDLNIGFIDALIRNVKTHRDAHGSQR